MLNFVLGILVLVCLFCFYKETIAIVIIICAMLSGEPLMAIASGVIIYFLLILLEKIYANK